MQFVMVVFQEWKDIGPLLQYGPTVVLLAIILVALLRAMSQWVPAWKEIKLKGIEADVAASNACVAQSNALESVSKVLYEVAIEQRRAADTVKILQHVNSRGLGDFEEQMGTFDDRLAQLERGIGASHASHAS